MAKSTSTELERPAWQTAPCPEWCVERNHSDRDHPDDRYHLSIMVEVAETLAPPVLYDEDGAEPSAMRIYLNQGWRDVEPHVCMLRGDSNEGFRMTLSEAREATAILLAMIREGRP